MLALLRPHIDMIASFAFLQLFSHIFHFLRSAMSLEGKQTFRFWSAILRKKKKWGKKFFPAILHIFPSLLSLMGGKKFVHFSVKIIIDAVWCRKVPQEKCSQSSTISRSFTSTSRDFSISRLIYFSTISQRENWVNNDENSQLHLRGFLCASNFFNDAAVAVFFSLNLLFYCSTSALRSGK